MLVAGGGAGLGVLVLGVGLVTGPWPLWLWPPLSVLIAASAWVGSREVALVPKAEEQARLWTLRLSLLTAWSAASLALISIEKPLMLAVALGARYPGWALKIFGHGLLAPRGIAQLLAFAVPAALIYAFLPAALKITPERVGEIAYSLEEQGPEEAEGLNLVLCRDRETGEPVVWPEGDRYTHASIVGPPGSGKSVLLQKLGAQSLAREDEGLVSVDTKGDLLFEKTQPYGTSGLFDLALGYNRKVQVVAPGYAGSAIFNPLRGDIEAAAQATVSGVMMLQRLTGSVSEYFATVGQAVLEHAIHLVKLLEDPNPSLWTFRAVISDEDYLMQVCEAVGARYGVRVGLPARNEKGIIVDAGVVGPAPAGTPRIVTDTLSWFLVTDYFKPGSEMRFHFQGTRLTLDTFFRSEALMAVLTPQSGREEIDLDRLLAGPDVLLVSLGQGVSGVGPELAAVLGRLFLVHLQHAVFRRPVDRRPLVQIQLDEFASYVTDSFPVLLQQARSYGVSLVLAYQGHSQLVAFRERAFADSVNAQSRSKVLFGGLSADDVEYFGAHFGTAMKEHTSRQTRRQSRTISAIPDSSAVGETVQEREEDFIAFNDLRFLPANEVVYEVMRDRTLQRARFGQIEALHPERLPTKRERERWDPLPDPVPQAAVPHLARPVQARAGRRATDTVWVPPRLRAQPERAAPQEAPPAEEQAGPARSEAPPRKPPAPRPLLEGLSREKSLPPPPPAPEPEEAPPPREPAGEGGEAATRRGRWFQRREQSE